MGQFLKQTLASCFGTLAGLILFFILGTSGLVLLVVQSALQDKGPVVKDRSVLVFDLSTQIKDTQAPSTLSDAFSTEDTKSITLRQAIDGIEKAARDKRIVAIFLDGRGENQASGYAVLAEVREALSKFRATGKKIIAYDVDWSERDYYLASVADTAVSHPMGMLELNGLSSQSTFLAGALDKYGIGVQVVRVGNYKSAVEPYTRQNFSPESRQQTEALLDDVWNSFLATVGESRKLSPEQLQAIADDRGILEAAEAQKLGLVDRVAYFDEVVTDLLKLTENQAEEDEPFRQIELSIYGEASTPGGKQTSANKIAVVYAEGAIVSGEGNFQQVGSDRLAKELRQLREDKNIKAVILRINSPGGSATASDIILREVQLIAEEKPVIVSMGNVAASGGYWIATGASQIFAQPSTITGSIGVFGLLLNLEEIANNNGITWDGVKTARLADISTVSRPKTPEELAIYQKSVNRVYQMFLEKVAKSRNLSPEKVAEIAQGRVWSGEDAQKIGLVDRLGGLEAAIQYAAERAELGNDWEIEEYPSKRSWEAEILQKLLKTEARKTQTSPDPVTAEFLRFKQELSVFQNFNDPQGIYTRLPFDFRLD